MIVCSRSLVYAIEGVPDDGSVALLALVWTTSYLVIKGDSLLRRICFSPRSSRSLRPSPTAPIPFSIQEVKVPLPTLLRVSVGVRVVPLTTLQVHAVHHP